MVCVVRLWKLIESEDFVAYLYGPDREHIGRLHLDKKTGGVSGDKTVPVNCFYQIWFAYASLAKARAEQMYKAREYPDEAFAGT
jgi:hypothetical protein